MTIVNLTVNGRPVSAEVEDRTLLVYFLREQLGLTGTHIGCDTSQCGACVVYLGGRAVKSCTLFACQADGAVITTIEGLAQDGKLHPVQEAFREHHALQCGFCTPGMIMTAVDMIRRNRAQNRAMIRRELEGNFCRCTGYHTIIDAIETAAKQTAGSPA
ncbi:MAG TPA: (2Fe-2S)-binding protein [Rhizomicrobium sp.]